MGFPADMSATADRLSEIVQSCNVCPRQCYVDRTTGETGFCEAGIKAQIASAGPHFGEESPLVGTRGSGTVFFSRCNLGCVFCQNAEISHRAGKSVSTHELADLFLTLQQSGCHNLNLVTPTPHLHAIISALIHAGKQGFDLPVVYNSSGFESPEVIELLNGVVDIYMPDIKSFDTKWCLKYLKTQSYPAAALATLKACYDQCGNLKTDSSGNAINGIIVRHLVMPNMTEDTKSIIDHVAEICGQNVYLNLMDQYRPCFQAGQYPEISRSISSKEWTDAVEYAVSLGLTRGLKRRFKTLDKRT
jgi:putative pyruvate formate lyase activating enzyme